MKTKTITKYETSDGQTFSKKENAQRHEMETWVKTKLPKDAKLTVPALWDIIMENSEEFVEKLGEVVGEG